MWPTKLTVLGLCCFLLGRAAGELESKPTAGQTAAEAAATTKLMPSIEEPRSKTEKRDSSDQTASIFTSKPAKESPFRPIYPGPAYYEAAETGPVFEPTTVRYTPADAAAQGYYEKPESQVRYVEQKAGLPGPLQFGPQQQQQQPPPPQQHRFKFAVPPQVELYQRPVAAVKSPHNPIYSYVESEPSIYERADQQQQQQSPAPQQQLAGQRVQYIIAIPFSYMRQLQQQLGAGLLPAAGSTAATPATAAAAASQSSMQLLGPLARDHQGVYRPYYHQSDLAAAPSAVPTPIAAYGQHYLQIPANVLLAAAQQLQQHHQQQQHQQQQQQLQAVYPKVAATPAALYQPLVYQQAKLQPQPQPQPQGPLHVQRIYQQAATIYGSEQPGAVYAYPQQQQQQQQQQQARLLRLGLKPADQQQHKFATIPSAATPTPAAATTTAATTSTLLLPTPAALHGPQQHPQQTLPIVHYNPIYVQAPAEHQPQQLQLQQQQHQFAILPRFSNNNPRAAFNLVHDSTPPIHVVRLTAANALAHQQPHPIHHYHQQQQHQQQQQQQQAVYHGFGDEQQQQQQPHLPSPGVIPYFSHPGAVHYGTHLYHPATTKQLQEHQQQQQLQQQQRQAATATATSGRLPGDNNAGGAAIKPATAASNVVKYP